MTPEEPLDFFGERNQPVATSQQRPSHGALAAIQSGWQPRPLAPPAADPQLPDLPAAIRCAEVMRYSVLRTEYWLSPGGSLREWLRLNVWLASMLAIPAILLVPVVTYLLTGLSTWTALLAQIVANVAWIPAGLLGGLLALSTFVFLTRIVFGRR